MRGHTLRCKSRENLQFVQRSGHWTTGRGQPELASQLRTSTHCMNNPHVVGNEWHKGKKEPAGVLSGENGCFEWPNPSFKIIPADRI